MTDLDGDAQEAPLQEPYLSLPLTASADCTRLVRVERNLSDAGFLDCRLQTVAFAERPKYDALSYRWGDESNKRQILVNWCPVFVTANLWSALDYLRTHQRELPIWVDALSINQSDVAEHSRQLRIMPHIYTRAASVVVWLGPEISQLSATPDWRDVDASSATMRLILANKYWSRVWIIQEIGKARKIEVLIGDEPWTWDSLIAWIEGEPGTEGPGYSDGPLKLERMRRSKYHGASTLKQLLEDHASAQCKNPKDKIYGLVGLATDSKGFPLDYSRSLLDVWSDTVRFMSRNNLLPRKCAPSMDFCNHIRSLLGGDKLDSVGGLVQFENLPDAVSNSKHVDEDDQMAQSSLQFQSTCYGVITSLGPSPSELLADLDLADQWAAELQKVHSADLDAAHEENDALMEYMLETEPQDTVFAKIQTWRNHRLDYRNHSIYNGYWPWYSADKVAPCLVGKWNFATTTPGEARLALVTVSEEEERLTSCKIALVPPGTLQGDLICRIDEYPMKRVILRNERWSKQDGSPRTHVFGTAIMAADLTRSASENTEWKRNHEYEAAIEMDASTLYGLLFGGIS